MADLFTLISSLLVVHIIYAGSTGGSRYLKTDMDLVTRGYNMKYVLKGHYSVVSCGKACNADKYCVEFGYRKTPIDDEMCLLFRTSGQPINPSLRKGFDHYIRISDSDTKCNSTNLGATENTWTIIQRRFDGSVGFERGWIEYKNGFGCQDGEFWLGLDRIHELTKNGDQKLRIELTRASGFTNWAEYSTFLVGDESSNYRLTLNGFTSSGIGDSMAWHNQQLFTTIDRENDKHPSWHCSYEFKAGWWYAGCHHANLNGVYGTTAFGKGINWRDYDGFYYSYPGVKMMIKQK